MICFEPLVSTNITRLSPKDKKMRKNHLSNTAIQTTTCVIEFIGLIVTGMASLTIAAVILYGVLILLM